MEGSNWWDPELGCQWSTSKPCMHSVFPPMSVGVSLLLKLLKMITIYSADMGYLNMRLFKMTKKKIALLHFASYHS